MATRQFLRLSDVCTRVGLRKSTVYKKIALNQFPAPIKLSARASVWPSDEIEAWQQQQIDSRGRAA